MEQVDQASGSEFRARRRDVARPVVVALGGVILLYAGILTFVFPWAIMEGLRNSGLGLVWALLTAGVGLVFMGRYCLVQFFAFREQLIAMGKPHKALDYYPIVSILVPAYNEGATILSAINSLLALDYPRFEVIVIDDGSTDETCDLALPMAGDYPNCTVKVIRKPNGGKWSALNLAYALSTGELILCVDADSRLAEDSLRRMVPRLYNPNVVAVCGQVTIRNRETLIARFQALEYLISNGGMRSALSAFGQVTVVPGPIGLYKRETLEAVAKAAWNRRKEEGKGKVYGPLSDATFAEDFELSLSALALGGHIVYEWAANAYTKCPEDIQTLMSQRYRWMRGTFQVCRIYRREMSQVARGRNPRLPWAMRILYPLDLYVVPILQISLFGIIGVALVAGFPMTLVLLSLGAVALLNMMTSAFFVITHDDEFSLLPLVFGMDLYSLVVRFSWLIAAIDEVRGSKMRWS